MDGNIILQKQPILHDLFTKQEGVVGSVKKNPNYKEGIRMVWHECQLKLMFGAGIFQFVDV